MNELGKPSGTFKAYQEEELIELYEQELADAARSSMMDFTVATKPNYFIGWHHRVMCRILDQMVRTSGKRIMIFMPPRHGKSELVSVRLPAYAMGLNPDLKVISASYSASLAAKMCGEVQKVMLHERYGRIFPDSRLSNNAAGRAKRTTTYFEVPGHEGQYRCAGVGGGITGMGGHLLIVDDPVKNREEANSPTYRERVWNWYTSTLSNRIEGDGNILITLTRWHEDDLAGRLLKLAAERPDAEQWEVIMFPAIREDLQNPLDPRDLGAPLWPEKYSLKQLMQFKAKGERDWSALYQQRPSSPEGGIVKREWLKNRYKQLPEQHWDEWLISADLTFKDTKGSDYVAMGVWARKGARRYLVHQIRDRMNFPQTVQAFKDLARQYPQAYTKLVEDKANGPALIASLQDEIPGIVAVEPQGSKEARLNSVAIDFEAGNVWLPDSSIAPWVGGYVEELVSFPAAANDDQVDQTTQALIRFRGASAGFPKEANQAKIASLTSSSRRGQW